MHSVPMKIYQQTADGNLFHMSSRFEIFKIWNPSCSSFRNYNVEAKYLPWKSATISICNYLTCFCINKTFWKLMQLLCLFLIIENYKPITTFVAISRNSHPFCSWCCRLSKMNIRRFFTFTLFFTLTFLYIFSRTRRIGR